MTNRGIEVPRRLDTLKDPRELSKKGPLELNTPRNNETKQRRQSDASTGGSVAQEDKIPIRPSSLVPRRETRSQTASRKNIPYSSFA